MVGQNGTIVSLTFTGTGVSVVGTLGESVTYGQPKTVYSIDNEVLGSYNAPFVPVGGTQYNVTFFTISNLSPEDHTVLVNNTDGTAPNQFLLDYFLVTPTPIASSGPDLTSTKVAVTTSRLSPATSSTTPLSYSSVSSTNTILSKSSSPPTRVQTTSTYPSRTDLRSPSSPVQSATTSTSTVFPGVITHMSAPPTSVAPTNGLPYSEASVHSARSHATVTIISAAVSGVFAIVMVLLYLWKRFRCKKAQVVSSPLADDEHGAVLARRRSSYRRGQTAFSRLSSLQPSCSTLPYSADLCQATERPCSLASPSALSVEYAGSTSTNVGDSDKPNTSHTPHSPISPMFPSTSTSSLIPAEVPHGVWYAPLETHPRAHALLCVSSSPGPHIISNAANAGRDDDSGLRLFDAPVLPPEYTQD
ncbi:hypothetical protein BC628DRAFT_1415155 [Trametes gibbosa]|nr:hypothetical protein BC628DRAFT_1415155 [Trametes gibbosa]